MRVNELNDLEIVTPEPCIPLGGYFHYPGNRNIVVSRNGTVVNLKTRKKINTYVHKSGYLQFVMSDGYLLSNNKYSMQAYKLHRVLALTFIGRPTRHKNTSHKQLTVNHIDGQKLNNDLSNLEWVTNKENIIHSHKNNLCDKDFPVLALNLLNNTVLRFNSIQSCAEYFSLSKHTLGKHLFSGNSGKSQKDYHIFKLDDGTEWIKYPLSLIKQLGFGTRSLDISIKNKHTGKVYVCSGVREASTYTGIPEKRLYKKINKFPIYETGNFIISRV